MVLVLVGIGIGCCCILWGGLRVALGVCAGTVMGYGLARLFDRTKMMIASLSFLVGLWMGFGLSDLGAKGMLFVSGGWCLGVLLNAAAKESSTKDN